MSEQADSEHLLQWNEHSVEVLQDSWEASESAFEEPDVEMGRQP